METLINSSEYAFWIKNIKSQIKQTQIKAATSVNYHLIMLYWNLGKQITVQQKLSKWGSGFIKQVSNDLKNEFPGVGGFSEYNLRMCRKFYSFYNQEIKDNWEQPVPKLFADVSVKWEQLVPKIPWGHHILILKKNKTIPKALFYISETIKNNWSRAVLEYQIETDLYSRQGKAISNFEQTLPKEDSDLAQQILKDPYNFDFLTLTQKAKEKDLEEELIEHITNFLLELGKGFAYMGRQYSLKVGEKEYRTDLLFYHTKLKAYIVIELKMKEFEPEFIGKLNFYISAINELVKSGNDKPTIGILLCKSKDNFIVDFSLKDVNKPIGVSEFTYTELPNEIKNALPSDVEFKNQLSKLKNEEN